MRASFTSNIKLRKCNSIFSEETICVYLMNARLTNNKIMGPLYMNTLCAFIKRQITRNQVNCVIIFVSNKWTDEKTKDYIDERILIDLWCLACEISQSNFINGYPGPNSSYNQYSKYILIIYFNLNYIVRFIKLK